jgi:hypothetical protein
MKEGIGRFDAFLGTQAEPYTVQSAFEALLTRLWHFCSGTYKKTSFSPVYHK